jgi:TPR repeat protein
MAPLDDLNGDAVLAEFEAIIRGSGHIEAGDHLVPVSRGLVPERRAVNWVNALAAIAREIEERQGPRRAEALLRTIGARMSRDLLTPLPSIRDEFEPAINRALSILDWGWVAVLERQGTIVLEHRSPWPFEKRTAQLRFVLEGFYTEILQRLANGKAMQVRLTGNRGGAMVLKWLPAEAAPAQASLPQNQSMAAPTPLPRSLPAETPAAAVPPEEQPLVAEGPLVAPVSRSRTEDLRLPPLANAAGKAARRPLAPQPAMAPAAVLARSAKAAGSFGAAPLLVAATVFIALFTLGMATSTGDIVGRVLHRLDHAASNGAATAMLYSLQSRARGGDADAQIRLGLKLAEGGARTADYAQAARWFQAAADSGSPEARYDLAVMTGEGLGVKRDPVGATILFTEAAAAGFSLAEYRLGMAFQKGLGVKRDAAASVLWYQRAARHGVRQAQFVLAGLYAAGEGVTADPITAFAWYRVAEAQGDREAADKRVALYHAMSSQQRAAAQAQSAALISNVNGARGLSPVPAHPTVDRLVAQLS